MATGLVVDFDVDVMLNLRPLSHND